MAVEPDVVMSDAMRADHHQPVVASATSTAGVPQRSELGSAIGVLSSTEAKTPPSDAGNSRSLRAVPLDLGEQRLDVGDLVGLYGEEVVRENGEVADLPAMILPLTLSCRSGYPN